MKLRGDKKRILFFSINAALLAVSIACILVTGYFSRMLQSQRGAERWQGESETEFVQISCFVPVGESFGIQEIGAFRNAAATKLHEAALDTGSDERLYADAWSCTGKVQASSNLGSGEASVIAVGGNFFDFHPLELINGNYIGTTDLMQDRVLLDEELAWLLFGGTDLQGLSMKIDGAPFVIAGVIEREQDFASKAAYSSGMGLYMSYDAYTHLKDSGFVSCYEIVMPEPVKNFAYNITTEIFPVKNGEIVNNSARFGFLRLLKVVSDFGMRSMQTKSIIYPYWENAARYTESICALLMLIALIAAAMPLVTAAVMLVRLVLRGKRRLKNRVLPKLRDEAEEAVRVRQRRRWEKKHGRHEG